MAKKKQLQTHVTWSNQEQYNEIQTAAKKEVETATAFLKKAAVKKAQEINKSEK